MKYYQDARRVLKDGTAPLKLIIRHQNRTVHCPVDNISLTPIQWDQAKQKVINHPRKDKLNSILRRQLDDIEDMFLAMPNGFTAEAAKHYILGKTRDGNMFIDYFHRHRDNVKKERTKDIYNRTEIAIRKFCSDINKYKFEDITFQWLTNFDKFLEKKSPSRNARNIHLRNIRAVFNDAIDDEITTNYPFRKFKLKNQETAKRSMSVGDLRTLMSYPCDEYQKKYVDIFILSFFLIGINLVDLSGLKKKNMQNNRITYNRSKTEKLYDIKVEPEAMEIIKKYYGDKYLLNILDRNKNYLNFGHRLNNALKMVGTHLHRGNRNRDGIQLFPCISYYWARHTWATIASELDIPKETISAALGHEIGSPITSIYIRYDRKKIDEANRKVIDFLLKKNDDDSQ